VGKAHDIAEIFEIFELKVTINLSTQMPNRIIKNLLLEIVWKLSLLERHG
jgi:hypothetical protein